MPRNICDGIMTRNDQRTLEDAVAVCVELAAICRSNDCAARTPLSLNYFLSRFGLRRPLVEMAEQFCCCGCGGEIDLIPHLERDRSL